MTTTKSQKARLGLFMVIAAVLLVGSIITLAGLKLSNRHDRYFVRFDESVSGLDSGSTVKMKGVPVGQVDSIRIADQVGTVVVTLALTPGTPVTTDTRAAISSVGITGLKFVELTGTRLGKAPIPPNQPNSYIKSEMSTLQSLTGQASNLANKLGTILTNVGQLTNQTTHDRVLRLLEESNRLASSWANLAQDNQVQVKRILTNLEKTLDATAKITQQNSADIRATVIAAEKATVRINEMAQAFKPELAMNEVTRAAKAVRVRIEDPEITRSIAAMNKSALQVETVAVDLAKIVRRRDLQIGAIMDNLHQASASLKGFARAIQERPSLILRGENIKERSIP